MRETIVEGNLWRTWFHGVAIYETNRKGPLFEAFWRDKKVATSDTLQGIQEKILEFGHNEGWGGVFKEVNHD